MFPKDIETRVTLGCRQVQCTISYTPADASDAGDAGSEGAAADATASTAGLQQWLLGDSSTTTSTATGTSTTGGGHLLRVLQLGGAVRASLTRTATGSGAGDADGAAFHATVTLPSLVAFHQFRAHAWPTLVAEVQFRAHGRGARCECGPPVELLATVPPATATA